jgi:PiT family inorganic phosphate transporter
MGPNHPLLLAAMLFAVVSGANDGSAILAANLGGRAVSPLVALGVVSALVVVGPYLFGTAVASTFAHGLVAFSGSEGATALTLAVVAAVVVVFVFSRLGLPTSVTQALIGGIVGAGLGLGFAVSWLTVAGVLALFAVAPLAAGLVAYGVANAIMAVRPRGDLASHLRRLHLAALVAQSAAYAANDAQKMVAVLTVAATGATAVLEPPVGGQLLLGGLFALGTLIGVERAGGRLSARLLNATPLSAIAAGFGTALAVLGSAALGAPVSTPQAASSGLVASTVALEGSRAVRWDQALRLAAVWLTTLPGAFLLGAALGLLLRS